mgnify:FL=1|jgi:copper chaperone CopZ
MKKVVKIKGMSCGHCQKRVEDALNKLPGMEATVNLKREEATITVSEGWDEQLIRDAIENAGYAVVSVGDKKGLFGR